MKIILSIITLLLLAAAPASKGQGYVFFNNRANPSGGVGSDRVVAPIYGPNPETPYLCLSGNAATNGGSVDYAGFPLLRGTGYTAELWAEDPALPDVFQPLSGVAAKVPFRTAQTLGGFITPSVQSVAVPWVTVNFTLIRFQVRAWDNANGTLNTYGEALATGTASGSSDIFMVQVNTPSASPPLNLYALTSFNLTVPVPEPSVMMLGALAGAALLWRRKKVSR